MPCVVDRKHTPQRRNDVRFERGKSEHRGKRCLSPTSLLTQPHHPSPPPHHSMERTEYSWSLLRILESFRGIESVQFQSIPFHSRRMGKCTRATGSGSGVTLVSARSLWAGVVTSHGRHGTDATSLNGMMTSSPPLRPQGSVGIHQPTIDDCSSPSPNSQGSETRRGLVMCEIHR